MVCERLESRRLMSVSLNPATKLLTVNGTAGDDVIAARVAGSTLTVTDNGTVRAFAAGGVARIAVYAGGGSDAVTLDASVRVPAVLDSGAGGLYGTYDTLQGGGGNDLIYLRSDFGQAAGGAGNDTLHSWGGFAGVRGEAGNDRLVPRYGASTESLFDGGTGADTIDYSAFANGMIIQNGQSSQYHLVPGEPPFLDTMYPDAVAAMESFVGTQGNDYIYGTDGPNYIDGQGGNDQVRARGGNDVLTGGRGADALFGDAGDDQFFSRDGVKDFLSGGAGYDRRRGDAIDVLNSVESSF